MLVIEADGQSTEPLLVDSIQIFAGMSLANYSSGSLQIPTQRPTLLLRRELIN
jgi:hypothetical protein